MSHLTIYSLACLIPLMLLPMVLPLISLAARKMRMVDRPNFRKLQEQPVPVMGGMVVVAVISVTLMCMNVFIDLDSLFIPTCMIVVLFVLGTLDDAVDIRFDVKLAVQVCVITLLFFGGNYRASDFGGLFGVSQLTVVASFAVSLFLGLYYINAINFMDGIDGLASAQGSISAAIIAVWCVRHGATEFAVLSFVFSGAYLSFFFFNVFSEKCKMYMGDSGSLVLGLYVYMAVCIDPSLYSSGNFLADHYVFSFPLAVFAAPLLDMARVCFYRVLRGVSPFKPDRSHLHHIFVDMGYSHFMATMIIVFSNTLVVLFWYLTARSGMKVLLQLALVIAVAFTLICMPAMWTFLMKKHFPDHLEKVQGCVRKITAFTEKGRKIITEIIDHSMPILK